MSKKRIAAVHMALIGSQGVHVGSQGNPRDGQGMMWLDFGAFPRVLITIYIVKGKLLKEKKN